jgi:tetratricopeptide (TPR) repeat protein
VQKKGRNARAMSKITETSGSLLDKYFYLFLSATVLLALALRIAALLSLKESIYFDFLLWDERVYHTWAKKIADGTFQSSSVYEMAPLPAYLMALIYKTFSPDVLYIRIANIFFGVLTCYLVYLIGKEMANRTVGLFACLVACLYKPFIFYSIVPLKTSLSVFLFASMVYFLVAILNRPSMTKAVLLGIALGFVQNVRPNCVVLIPLIPLLIAWNYYKDKFSPKILGATLVLYGLGLLIANSPFMIRNYMVAGETSATVSQSGFNLFMCNNLKYSYPLPFATTSPFEQGVQFTIEASRRVGKRLTSREASAYWTGEVIKTVLEQPAAFVWGKCKKALAFFSRLERGDHYHIGFLSQFVPFFKIPFPGIWLIIPFGMAGMALNMFVSRKRLAPSPVFLVYVSTLVLFFTNVRVRLPMLIILIPFVVIGINDFIGYVKKRDFKRVGVFLGIAAAFFVIEFLPDRSSGDMTAYQNTHAIILNSMGRKDEAITYWEMSSRADGHYSPFANLSLAGKYYGKGDIKKAVYYLDRISEDSFAAAQKYDLLGDIMLRQKKVRRALEAYEKSLAINSGQRQVRMKLVKIFDKIDKRRSLEEQAKLKYINSFYDLY